MGAFEIIGLESGCCEEKSARNTNLVGELKNIGTANLLEECEKLTSLKIGTFGPSRVTGLFLFLHWKGCQALEQAPQGSGGVTGFGTQ